MISTRVGRDYTANRVARHNDWRPCNVDHKVADVGLPERRGVDLRRLLTGAEAWQRAGQHPARKLHRLRHIALKQQQLRYAQLCQIG